MTALETRDKDQYRFGFTIMDRDKELLLVEWNPYHKGLPKIRTTPISCTKHWAIPNALFSSTPSLNDFDKFLTSRCFDRTREDAPQLLEWYGLAEYCPLGICKKSFGCKMEDFIWIRFDGMENTHYDDIKLR